MTTLHIFRSRPDGQTRELVRAMTQGEARQIVLYEECVDYDRVIGELFSHDRVVSWW